MTVRELRNELAKYTPDMPVNVHIQYKTNIILRSPGVKLCFVDNEGNIQDEFSDQTKEISLFVEEALYKISKGK